MSCDATAQPRHFTLANASFSSDLFLIPAAVSARTLAQGVLVVALATAATAWLIRRSADRLDLIRALKTRE